MLSGILYPAGVVTCHRVAGLGGKSPYASHLHLYVYVYIYIHMYWCMFDAPDLWNLPRRSCWMGAAQIHKALTKRQSVRFRAQGLGFQGAHAGQ